MAGAHAAQAFLDVLDRRAFPIGSIKFLASKNSAGKHVAFRGQQVVVEELTERSFDGVDLALFRCAQWHHPCAEVLVHCQHASCSCI